MQSTINSDYNAFIQLFINVFNSSIPKGVFDFQEFQQSIEVKFSELGFRKAPQPYQNGWGGGKYWRNEKILVIRNDAIGDFVLTSAAIRELRMNYPNAFITLLVSKRTQNLAEFCPYVNEVLVFDPKNNAVDHIAECLKFAMEHFWSKHYDLAINFIYWQTFHSQILMYLSGARERLGYSPNAPSIYLNKNQPLIKDWRLTYPVQHPPEIVHDVSRDLYLLQAYGMKIRRTDLEIWYSQEDYDKASDILKDFSGRFKVVAGIGGGNPARHYPKEKYLEAFKKIIEKGAAIIILGGSAESEDAKFLKENLPSEHVKNIVELNLTLRVTAALIAQTDLYIGNDTGIAHIAAATQIPTIKLFPEAKDRELIFDRGFSHYAEYYPYQNTAIVLRPEHPLDKCREILHYIGCSENKPHCITQIKPEEIVAAFEEIAYFMKFSKIKRIDIPAVNNSYPKLGFKFEFDR